jgi:uncharacterized protein (DUF1778 family)
MKKSRGAPRKSAKKAKAELIQLRVNAAEKQAFVEAAELDGKKLSEWIRDRLRRVSRDELQQAGRVPAFLSGHPASSELR